MAKDETQELVLEQSGTRKYLYDGDALKRNVTKPSSVVCEFVVNDESWLVICPIEQFFIIDINELLKNKEIVRDPKYDLLLKEHVHSRLRKQETGITELTSENFQKWAQWTKANYNLQYELMEFTNLPYKLDAKIDLDNKHFYMRESMFHYFKNNSIVKIAARFYGYTFDVVPDEINSDKD